MASTGADAWNKHFKGKGDLATVMKKDSPLEDATGKSVGKIKAGESVIAVSVKKYEPKIPIIYKKKRYFTTFNNIQKPASKLVSSVKLKPQDFKAMKVEREWKTAELAKTLISEVEERKDLEGGLKSYIIELTKYWAKLPGANKTTVRKHYKAGMKGINEIQKDYGEMLGAMACIQYNLLKPPYTLTTSSKMLFPLRGNEPIVDYYIIKGSTTYNISAKTTSSATNTLKPADAIMLLEKRGLDRKWKKKVVYKIFQMISEYSVVEFPFQAINEVHGKKIITDAGIKEAGELKKSDFLSTDVPASLSTLINVIDMPTEMKKQPTVGQVWYYTEKYIINTINNKYSKDLSDIFAEATSGLVIYVKYGISNSKPEGEFKVDIEEQQSKNVARTIKLRSKNSTNRAADKVGLQP